MVIFHSYVKLPEGIPRVIQRLGLFSFLPVHPIPWLVSGGATAAVGKWKVSALRARPQLGFGLGKITGTEPPSDNRGI